MANRGTYANLSDIRSALVYSSSDVADNTRLLEVLEEASRYIDEHCHRHFYVISETRYFTARDEDELIVDDLLSVTSLKTDDDGDRTYENTWAATDYDLEPYNKWPKWLLRVTPDGDYSFSTERKGVEVAGLWGYGDGARATPYDDAQTDTAEALDATETAVDVGDGTKFAVGQTILVESEQMYITSITTNTLTVERGVNGTTAATHVTAKDVYIYRYPLPVKRACLRQAQRTFRLEAVPFGVQGSAEMGTVQVTAYDPEILRWLAPFRNLEAV